MELLKNPLVLLSIYATACYVLTFITRKVVENIKPSWKKQADENEKKVTYCSTAARWWNEVILYSIAPAYGVGLALSLKGTDYFPAELKGSTMVAIMTGLVCGFTCGWFFKIFKRLLSRGAKMEEKDLNGASPTPEVPGGK